MIVRKIDGVWQVWRGVNEPFSTTVTTATLTYADGRQETVEVEPYTIEVSLSARAVADWPDGQLAEYGLARPVTFVVPEGKRAIGERRFEEADGRVHEVFDLEDVPPPPPEPTREEKVAQLAADYGLTVDDLKAAIAGDKISQAEAVEIASKV